jgi:hypothetical protein
MTQTNAFALALWLPDVQTNTPNSGDVVEVLAVPPGEVPQTHFAPNAGGGGGGGVSLPRATTSGQFLVAGTGPTYTPTWGDGDCGRF